MADENTTQAAETTVDSVDLSTLTADQLVSLSEEEWNEFYTVVNAAVAAKKAQAKAELKARLEKAATAVKTYALPTLKYIAGAYVVAKIAGVI